MTVKVTLISGPDNGAFLYLRGDAEGYPHAAQVRSVALASVASGAVTVAAEKAALIADVEQAIVNLQAAAAALQELQ